MFMCLVLIFCSIFLICLGCCAGFLFNLWWLNNKSANGEKTTLAVELEKHLKSTKVSVNPSMRREKTSYAVTAHSRLFFSRKQQCFLINTIFKHLCSINWISVFVSRNNDKEEKLGRKNYRFGFSNLFLLNLLLRS